LSLLAPAPASAAGDPYAADPNRLVPFKDTIQQPYTSGTDVWEVWVCDVANWNSPVNLGLTVSALNSTINPYFGWLSGGDYTTSFVAGGTVTSNDVITQEQIDTLEKPFAPDCEAEVAGVSASSPNGVLIVVDIPFGEGYATVGAICPEPPFNGCETTYPANARRAVVGAGAVTTVFPVPEPFWNVVAHEIGHTLNWAHSYGGLTTDPDTGSISQYDNPMDVMSGGISPGVPVGVIAYDRYAAGWIDPSNTVVHTQGTALYQLAPIGGGGLEMLIIPGDSEGHFYAIGARRKVDFDSKLPAAGVEVYEVDQRREIACAIPAEWPATWPCFATLVRIKQTPPVQGMNGTAHVLGIDEEMTVGGFTLRVLSAGTSAFSVRVAERDSGTFIDDDGNIHEPNIEAIAAAGITNGCNPPDNDRFCPDRDVSRGEMAAFLIRAMGLEDFLLPYQGTFSDIPAGLWYTPYVETLAAQGVTTGYLDGTYRADSTVSRAEMAVFLVRAFVSGAIPSAQGIFADVPQTAWYADEAEKIYADGISLGCNSDPLSYCPLDAVRRDSMASFLARALGIGS
ncbi:MAG: S-layer homology domain-containing protein, partial [Acidimicrobiia bacterium]